MSDLSINPETPTQARQPGGALRDDMQRYASMFRGNSEGVGIGMDQAQFGSAIRRRTLPKMPLPQYDGSKSADFKHFALHATGYQWCMQDLPLYLAFPQGFY